MLGVTVAYSLTWLLLLLASPPLWFLPAGLRLGALWLTPTRRWGWLAAGEWAAMGGLAFFTGWHAFDQVFLTVVLAPWLTCAAVVLLVRGPAAQPLVDNPRRMLQLLGAGLVSAALLSPMPQQLMPGMAGESDGIGRIFAFLYGNFLGQLGLAPLLIFISRAELRRRLDLKFWLDTILQLLIALLVFLLIRQWRGLEPYLLLLAFAPIFFVGFRQGWEGAAVSVTALGLMMVGLLHLGIIAVDLRQLQLALAVVGGGGLVLGAASSELRRSHERLASRHHQLSVMNRALLASAGELRSVSQRLVRLEEQGQRELALELDYELGRSIHALSTRISLAFREVREEQMLRLLESMREQVREMQESLRRVLRQLRPSALDSHGLREAVGFGPLRDMLEDAGIGFETAFYGRLEALNDDAQTTVYRICQAAVREATRSELIRRLLIRIDVLPGVAQRLEVHIQIDVEVSPFLDFPIEPYPLPAITDRVLAQHGSYRVEALSPGIRHLVQFEEDPAFLL